MNQLATTSTIRYILTSHSIDNVFDYCPRKFEFLNVWERRPPRESGYAASVGTALHDGWQAWMMARAEGLDTNRCIALGFKAMCLAFPWDEELLQKTGTRSFHNCALLLYTLIRSPEWDDWELVRVKDKGWAVEVPFLIRHESLGVFTIKNTGEQAMLATQGKIDVVLRHKVTGEIRGWDLKTTINSKDMVESEYKYSGQQVGYGEVISAALGTPVKEFSVWYMIARFSATEVPEIQPVEYIKREYEVDDYWLAKLDRLERMKRYAETGWFPRTNGGCNSWNTQCAFFDICESRDNDLIRAWFHTIQTEPQRGYDWWITMAA